MTSHSESSLTPTQDTEVSVATSRESSLWHHPNFFRLWLSETISAFGGQFSGLGILFTATLVLKAHAQDIAFLTAVQTAPFLIFGLIAGVWVDRHLKRRIMVAANIGRAIVLGSIPIVFLIGRLSMPWLYLTSFLVGTLQVFYDISYQAYLPALVERQQISEGNSKLEGSRSTSQVAGPTMAGVVIQAVSAPFTIAVDAIGFIASALSLSGIDRKETISVDGPRPSVLHDIREGLAVVFGDDRLRSIAGSTATSNFFSSALGPISFFYWTNTDLAAKSMGLGLDPSLVGLIFSFGSIGGILGALSYARIARRIGVGWAIISSMLVGTIAAFTYYIATPSMSNSILRIYGFSLTQAVTILVIGQFVISIGVVIYNVNQVSLRQAIVPLHLQGRMNATMRFLVWGTLPLGGLFGGILVVLIGVKSTILVTAMGGTLSFLWVLFSPVRNLKTIPEPMS